MVIGKHGLTIAKDLQKALHESLGAPTPPMKIHLPKKVYPHPSKVDATEWDKMSYDEKIEFNEKTGMKVPLPPLEADYNSEEYINWSVNKKMDSGDTDPINVTAMGDTHKQWLDPTTGVKTQGYKIGIHTSEEIKLAPLAKADLAEEGYYKKIQDEIIDKMALKIAQETDESILKAMLNKPVDSGSMHNAPMTAMEAMESQKVAPIMGVDLAKKGTDKSTVWGVVNDPSGKYLKMEPIKTNTLAEPQYYVMDFLKEDWVNDPELKAKYTVGSFHEFPGSPATWRLKDVFYDITTQKYKLTFIEANTKKPWKTSNWVKQKADKPIWGNDWPKADPTPETKPLTKMKPKVEIKTERDKVFANIGG